MVGTPPAPAAAVSLLLSCGKPSLSIFSPVLSPADAPLQVPAAPRPPHLAGRETRFVSAVGVRCALLLRLLPLPAPPALAPCPRGGLGLPWGSPGAHWGSSTLVAPEARGAAPRESLL